MEERQWRYMFMKNIYLLKVCRKAGFIMLYTIVKVGKSSDIKLRNTKAYRAVNFSEVEKLLSKKENISLVIYEDITEDDIDFIKNIAGTYTNSYVTYGKQEVSSELTDRLSEIGIPYIIGLRDLQNYIETNIGIVVSTYPKEKTEEIEETQNIVDIDITEENTGNEPESNADKLSDFDLFSGSSTDEEPESEEENNAIADELAESLKAMQENIDVISTNDNDNETESENISIVIKSKEFLKADDKVNRLLNEDDENIEETDNTDILTSSEVEKVIQEKDEEIDNLNNQLQFALKKLKDLSFIRENLQEERDTLLKKIEDIIIDDDVTEVIIGTLDRDGYEKRINELQDTISELNLKVMDIEQLTSRVDKLKEKIQEQDDTETQLREEITRLKDNTEVDQLTKQFDNRLRAEVKSRLSLSEIVCALTIKLDSVNTALINKTRQFNESIEVLENLRQSVYDNENKLSALKSKYEAEVRQNKANSLASESKISELNESIQTLRGELSQLEFEIEQKQRQYDEAEAKSVQLRSDLDSTSAMLKAANERIKKQEERINEYNSKNYEEIQLNSEALEHSQKELLGTVGNYKKKVHDLEQQINSRALEIDTLKKQNDELRSQNKAIQLNTRLGNLTTFDCNYTGRAIILQVFGSGSVGVTTTAISLCNKLRGRVLFMDLDVVAPKAEGWFAKSPIIKSLVDIPQNAVMFRTAFGAFLYKDIDFVIDHESEIIQNIILTKDGFRLDYFSGLYTKADISMFMSADFSQLFTYFGNSYDYIICDTGRIGGSETQSALIRTIDLISLKNICVCMHDSVDIRSAAIRIGNEQVKRDKTIWLLNMAMSTKLDSVMQKSMAKSPYVLMPKNMSIFGTKTSFDKVNLLKDKLSELSDKILNK